MLNVSCSTFKIKIGIKKNLKRSTSLKIKLEIYKFNPSSQKTKLFKITRVRG